MVTKELVAKIINKLETDDVGSQPAAGSAFLDIINEVTQILASTRHSEETLRRLMVQVEKGLAAEAGALLINDSSTGVLALRMALGERGRTKQIKSFCLTGKQNMIGRVIQNGKPLLLTKVEPSLRPSIKLASYLQVEPHSLLAVPLILSNQIIGVLAALNKKTGTFTQHDMSVLKMIAAQAALVIENEHLRAGIRTEQNRAVEIEEQVRHKVARDLHDGPLQLASSMVMRANFCQKVLQENSDFPLLGEIIKIQEQGHAAIHQMRTLLIELRPLELEQGGQGLAAALRIFLDHRQKESQTIEFCLEIVASQPNKQISRLDPKVEAGIFVIVQETVNNALKHAQASTILVRLEETNTIINLFIADDGQGFDPVDIRQDYAQSGSLGLFNIQERAEIIGGELSIESIPSQGTQITLQVPKS